MGIILPLLYLGAGFGLAMLLPEHWGNRLKESASAPVSYTHLTLPTSDQVQVSVVAA